jgi:hypothetical protein
MLCSAGNAADCETSTAVRSQLQDVFCWSTETETETESSTRWNCDRTETSYTTVGCHTVESQLGLQI